MIYTAHPTANAVLNFWFDSAHKPLWFAKCDAFDVQIREQFGDLIIKAVAGELWKFRGDNYGRLAEILILDQFTRNAYRDTPSAFMGDEVALILAQEAISLTAFSELPIDFQVFTAMPFMHSESLAIHDRAVEVFRQIGDESTLDFEYQHKQIIERFGRYPHRNAILGRTSTFQEMAFLQTPNASF